MYSATCFAVNFQDFLAAFLYDPTCIKQRWTLADIPIHSFSYFMGSKYASHGLSVMHKVLSTKAFAHGTVRQLWYTLTDNTGRKQTLKQRLCVFLVRSSYGK